MSYELHPGEKLGRALKRVNRTELRKGRQAMAGRKALAAGKVLPQSPLPSRAAKNAHVLRVATKKVRAMARLVEPVVGRKARRADRAIGACADVVAPLRDADAAVRTFGKLRAALPARMRRGTDVARAALTERLRHEQQQAEDPRSLRKLTRALRREQQRVGGWTPDGDGWKSVGPGFALGYQRARRAMHRAYRKPTGETFHAWRRAVKAHRFQVRFASAWLPAELDARTDALATLAEYLGDEHDLTMLRRTLRANRFWFGEEGETYYEVLRRIDQQRREKRVQAQPLGEQLFAEPTGALLGRIREGFRAYRRTRSRSHAAA